MRYLKVKLEDVGATDEVVNAVRGAVLAFRGVENVSLPYEEPAPSEHWERVTVANLDRLGIRLSLPLEEAFCIGAKKRYKIACIKVLRTTVPWLSLKEAKRILYGMLL